MEPAAARKKDEEDFASPFDGLQKSKVLNSCRIFHQSPIEARKCCNTLTELLWLISLGEKFTETEAEDLFFGVTKLFESNDAQLRRMVYLVIKELNQDQSKAFIIINSLEQDINARIDLSKANAIRVLSQVIDASFLEQPHTQRYLQTAIVSQNPFVASSALLAGMHLFDVGPEMIKRWVNKIQDALLSPHNMVQFHALHLLYMIKRRDQRAVQKVVESLCSKPPESPLAHCLLIRYAFSTLGSTPSDMLVNFFKRACQTNDPMVAYEAARALCNARCPDPSDILPAISVLRDMLRSHKPTNRFSAVRTLSQVVIKYPVAVTQCMNELEALTNDPNRNIATLATITMLKTGLEESVDHLMSSVNEFMSDISDELKIVLVEAIRALCLKFPKKFRGFLDFLSNILREEGGFQYKKFIVDSMLEIMEKIEESREAGLEHLCEFIEDCEFSELSIRILHLLGETGPKTRDPTKYIRFIFNRVILELPCVRCAAVTSLAKFGSEIPSIAPSILVLLKRCLNDNDDEVRDRATFYIHVLEESAEQQQLDAEANPAPEIVSLGDFASINIANLEFSLNTYLKDPPGEAFDLDKHLVENVLEENPQDEEQADLYQIDETETVDVYKELQGNMPELAELGAPFRSTTPVELTEKEAEYQVQVIKHIHDNHVVFQFNVENTVESQLLTKVSVDLQYPEGLENLFSIEAKELPYGKVGQVYIVCTREEDCLEGDLEAVLQFTVKDASVENPEYEEGYEDEYDLNSVELSEKDFVLGKKGINTVQFKQMYSSWDGSKAVKKANIPVNSIKEAVRTLMGLLNLSAIGNTDSVAEDKPMHTLHLYGEFLGGTPVVAIAQFLKKKENSVKFKVDVRSPSSAVSQAVVTAIYR